MEPKTPKRGKADAPEARKGKKLSSIQPKAPIACIQWAFLILDLGALEASCWFMLGVLAHVGSPWGHGTSCWHHHVIFKHLGASCGLMGALGVALVASQSDWQPTVAEGDHGTLPWCAIRRSPISHMICRSPILAKSI